MYSFNITSVFGIFFILLGLILFLIPLLIKINPVLDFEKIPWLILYVYNTDNFIFATSPILIILSLISIVYSTFKI
jgi:hypothetical protein